MNKYAVLLFVLAIVSCKKEAVKDYALFSGKVTNAQGKEITVLNNNETFKKVIKLNDDGTFSDTLKITSGNYFFHDGKTRAFLYLLQGDNVNVNFDANDFKNSIKYDGVGAVSNNYLAAKDNLMEEVFGKTKDLYSLEEQLFVAKVKEGKSVLENMLASTTGLPKEFVEAENKGIFYNYAIKLNNYQDYHRYFAKNEEFKASESLLEEIKSIDFNNETDYNNSLDYKNLVSSYINKLASELAVKDGLDNDLAYVRTAGEKLTNQNMLNDVLYNNAKNGITYTNNVEGLYNEFMKFSTNEDHKKEITESYTKLKTVAKGQPSPKFVDYENINGATTSLEDLKGKFVYVDVWATWCGPCIAEIPSLKEIEKEYHGKNIAFVSISVDTKENHDKWKTMVKTEELSGIQLFADNDWKSSFVEGYLIKGIPRFILIDPQGNIVNANAPRPSQVELKDLFNEVGI